MKHSIRLIGIVLISLSLVVSVFALGDEHAKIIDGDIGAASPNHPYVKTISTKGETMRIEIIPQKGANLTVLFDGSVIEKDATIDTKTIGIHELRIESDQFITVQIKISNQGVAPMVVLTALVLASTGAALILTSIYWSRKEVYQKSTVDEKPEV